MQKDKVEMGMMAAQYQVGVHVSVLLMMIQFADIEHFILNE